MNHFIQSVGGGNFHAFIDLSHCVRGNAPVEPPQVGVVFAEAHPDRGVL